MKRRSHAAQFHPADRFRPPPAQRAADQRVAIGRQVDRGRAPGRDARQPGKRTLLIDGDLRRPSVHRLYQVPNSVGLSNVLLQQISWRDAVVRMPEPEGLDILPAGPSTRRASDLIGMGLAELMEEATREYDLVVLDAPPLLGFAEPLQMASAVDGVIVVARAGDTSRNALAR